MESSTKRPRISIDVQPELRHRIRLAAARRDLTVQQYLREAIEAQLHEDLGGDADATLTLTASTDPILAELWDNPKDAEYDRL
jgi:predicted DNA-binding protein